MPLSRRVELPSPMAACALYAIRISAQLHTVPGARQPFSTFRKFYSVDEARMEQVRGHNVATG